MLIRDLRDVYRKELKGLYPPEETDQIFYILLEHYTGLPRFITGLEPGRSLDHQEEEPLFLALHRLRQHEPVQYITGKAHFMDLELRVGPEVLIPRPETEELVRWILESHGEDLARGRILDIGTGSGCIALGLADAMQSAEVWAVDVSEKAVELASGNAHDADLKITLRTADITDPGTDWPQFDLIASNPPYVPAEEAVSLSPHVRESEPSLALFAPSGDPLYYYRHIVAFANMQLRPEGWLYLEIHHTLGADTASLLKDAGFEEVLLKKDIFGKDRFIRARKGRNIHPHKPLPL